jgi:hypothetical protein
MRLYFLIFLLGSSFNTFAQIPNQLNLDDVQIKGEASGSNLLNISSRKKNNISDRISVKSSLTDDILESLPEGFNTEIKLIEKKKK